MHTLQEDFNMGTPLFGQSYLYMGADLQEPILTGPVASMEHLLYYPDRVMQTFKPIVQIATVTLTPSDGEIELVLSRLVPVVHDVQDASIAPCTYIIVEYPRPVPLSISEIQPELYLNITQGLHDLAGTEHLQQPHPQFFHALGRAAATANVLHRTAAHQIPLSIVLSECSKAADVSVSKGYGTTHFADTLAQYPYATWLAYWFNNNLLTDTISPHILDSLQAITTHDSAYLPLTGATGTVQPLHSVIDRGLPQLGRLAVITMRNKSKVVVPATPPVFQALRNGPAATQLDTLMLAGTASIGSVFDTYGSSIYNQVLN